MSKKKINSMERVLTAISHKEPDRVPLMLLLSLYGAKESNMTPKKYFSKVENIVSAQLKMKEKYDNDCLYGFLYAGIEVEARGGSIVFSNDGPPNAGEPIIKELKDIDELKQINIKTNKHTKKVLNVIKGLKENDKGETPIIGVVMSPFSVPIMQMGFEKYLKLIYFHKTYFKKLMKINEKFCVDFANAQIDAGATAICYFNPMASPNIVEKETYMSMGYDTDKETLKNIKGATCIHLASGITEPIIDELINLGPGLIGVSNNDDLGSLKKKLAKKVSILGNLNALDMINWDNEKVEIEVKKIIKEAGKNGGFIISDNHGEIPMQVKEETLLQISKTIKKYGKYPLKWIDDIE